MSAPFAGHAGCVRVPDEILNRLLLDRWRLSGSALRRITRSAGCWTDVGDHAAMIGPVEVEGATVTRAPVRSHDEVVDAQ